MHGLVPLGKEGNVLRPAVIWCDSRAGKECAELTEKVGRDRLVSITGNPAIAGFTAVKILWIKNHEPEIYKKIARILLPKDYIRYCLTGEFFSEASDSSGTQLLNLKRREWSDEILNILDIDRKLLPELKGSAETAGKISALAAKETGLIEGTLVAGGAGDQAASAIGLGAIREGVITDTIGSSGVVFAAADGPKIDPSGRVQSFCHANGKWHLMGVTQGAGLSLSWLRDNICGEEKSRAESTGVSAYKLMDEEAERVSAGSGGLIFLPYLAGERSPILDPKARGVFFGLSQSHTKAHMIRSVLEGVTFSQYDCLKVLNDIGITASEIRMGGGGAKSPFWRQMFADVFNVKTVAMTVPDAGTLGASLLAGVSCGLFPSIESAVEKYIKPSDFSLPKDSGYEKVFEKYKKIYEAVKNLF
jgi:D-xylulose kinase